MSSKCVVAAILISSNAALSTVPQQSSAMSYLLIKVTKADIIWALHGIRSHLSVQGNSRAADLFHLVFQYSYIAAWFKMQKDKNCYIVIYGCCPYFPDQLVSGVKVYCSAVSFDDNVTQKGQMDVVIQIP